MTYKNIPTAFAACFVATQALAGTVTISVSDSTGRPLSSAVVELSSDSSSNLPASRVPAEAIIDQRHETFIPLVSLLRKGGRVVFTNNDTTMHQVYSFSPIKQFQFEIDQGKHSEPLVFNTVGVASIGCNIHDQMITYVYVANSPFATMTDAKGLAEFDSVPPGSYHAKIWHPQQPPGKIAPSPEIAVQITPISISITAPFSFSPQHMMTRMHMGGY